MYLTWSNVCSLKATLQASHENKNKTNKKKYVYYLYKNILIIFHNFWIKLSIIWRIIEIEEGVI